VIVESGLRAARVLSLDGELQSLLFRLAERGGALVVHSVFDHALNLLDDTGRLVTFASTGLDDAPWTLRAEAPEWPSFPLNSGDALRVRPSAVVLPDGGALVEGWRDARLWAPALPVADDGAPSAELLDALGAWLAVRGTPGGMLAGGSADPFERGAATLLAAGAKALREAVIRDSKKGRLESSSGFLDAAVLNLLGLGTGLTPSGDDHLTGFALVAARPGSRLAGFGDRLLSVLDGHPGRTTAVSEATLREAARGRARQSLLELLAGMTSPWSGTVAGRLGHLDVHLVRVLGIGRTSGTDILSGLLAGLRVERELRGSV